MKTTFLYLRYKADLRTLVFVATHFALIVGGYLMFYTLSWPLLILGSFISCQLAFLMAVIVHNTIHSPIFTKKSWNKGFQWILSLAYGYSVSSFVPGHNLSHHKHNQTEKDITRTSLARFRWNFLNQALFVFIVAGELIKQEGVFIKMMKKENPAWYHQWLGETIFVNTVKIGLIILNWQAGLAFIIIPHLYGLWGLLGTNVWQHDGCDPDHPYNHSRTFTNKFLNFLMFNNGYHGAHHDKPALHWSLLPEYHKKHIQPHLHPNLNRNSLVLYCIEAYIWPGKRVDYLGNPLPVPAATPSEDWVEDVRNNMLSAKGHFGAEDLSYSAESEIHIPEEFETGVH